MEERFLPLTTRSSQPKEPARVAQHNYALCIQHYELFYRKLLFRSKSPPSRRIFAENNHFIMIKLTLPVDRYDQFIREAAESVAVDNAADFIRQMLVNLARNWWYGATIRSLVKQVRQLLGLDFAQGVEQWLRALEAKYAKTPPPAEEPATIKKRAARSTERSGIEARPTAPTPPREALQPEITTKNSTTCEAKITPPPEAQSQKSESSRRECRADSSCRIPSRRGYRFPTYRPLASAAGQSPSP